MAVTRTKLAAFIRVGPLAEMLAGLSVSGLEATERCRSPILSGCPDWSSPQSDRLGEGSRSHSIAFAFFAWRAGANGRYAMYAGVHADGDPQSKRRLVRGETPSPVTCTVRG